MNILAKMQTRSITLTVLYTVFISLAPGIVGCSRNAPPEGTQEKAKPEKTYTFRDGAGGIITGKHAKGQMSEVTRDRSGRLTIHYESGDPWLDAEYVNGKMHGRSRMWFEDGTPMIEGYYKAGLNDGQHIHWYENGEKATEINWRDGKKHGLFVTWDSHGEEDSRRMFENDVEVELK